MLDATGVDAGVASPYGRVLVVVALVVLVVLVVVEVLFV